MAAAKDLGLRGERAEAVRKRVGEVAQQALLKLAAELELYDPHVEHIPRGRGKSRRVDEVLAGEVPTHWVERFAKIADQIRRDYVIDESADTETHETKQPEQPPADRLKRLKVV